ncbi:MAG: hypothetical protein RLN89_13665 [Parvibaculum sp.]
MFWWTADFNRRDVSRTALGRVLEVKLTEDDKLGEEDALGEEDMGQLPFKEINPGQAESRGARPFAL